MKRSPNWYKEKRQAYDEVRLLAGEVSGGQTLRTVCPLCRGGRTGESSFAITAAESDQRVFHCHRASCGFSGVVGGRAGGGTDWGVHVATGRMFTPKLFTHDTRALEEDELCLIHSRWGIEEATARWASWGATVDDGRLVVPVWSPRGIRRGVESRLPVRALLQPRSGRKAISYRERDEVWMGWYSMEKRSGPVVVVEDSVSALKVAQASFRSCFLIGTALGMDKLAEIKAEAGDEKIVLALDRDATGLANDYQKRYRLLAPNLVVLPLHRDLKYETDNQIKELVGGCVGS